MQYIAICISVFIALASCAKLPFDGRIVGGQTVDIEDFPYQVSVRVLDSHICGGSIISENKVLTAAHCTDRVSPGDLTVRVGSAIHSQGQSYKLSQVLQNPKYDSWYMTNDVSVLKTSENFEFGLKVQPIKLATQRPPTGTSLVVSGWGVLSEGSSHIPDNLQAVSVPAIDQNDCKNFYKYEIVTEVMICAGYPSGGKDSCQGDSGGPLVDISTKELVGVVSWGYGCAKPNYPGVYAFVPNLLEFILNA